MNETTRIRASIVGVVTVALFVALFGRLWFLQLSSSENLAAAAEANSQRTVYEEAPRGRILDREGRVLVENRRSIILTAARDLDEDERDLAFGRLSELLAARDVRTAEGDVFTPEVLRRRYDSPLASRFKPAVLAVDLPEDILVSVAERANDFPGIEADEVLVRHYPHGDLAAHLLGYVGQIGEEDLGEREGYQLGDTIGRAGAERAFESFLRGTPARSVIEVDPLNRPVRAAPLEHDPATPGSDVYLALDLEVQQAAEHALTEAIRQARTHDNPDPEAPEARFAAPGGAVVVLDVTDGSVVAMASHPTFPIDRFAGRIPQDLWDELNAEDGDGRYGAYPLVNRATQGLYAPGSTFKLVTALAALEDGFRTPATTIEDRGAFVFAPGTATEQVWRNAGGRSYGAVDLRRSLSVSSDVYYYQIGYEFWCGRTERGDPRCDTIQETSRAFGFGAPTGILLPENSGTVPDEEWKAALAEVLYDDPEQVRENSVWRPGDNVNLSIGQGDFLGTPLQLANAYAAFGNGGTLWVPRLGDRVAPPGDGDQGSRISEPTVLPTDVIREIPLDPAHRGAILDGLLAAVGTEEGTAFAPFLGFPLDEVPVAGKTGTAEVSTKADTALFSAIVPADAPRFAVAAVIEEAGFGSRVAAPVVRHVIEVLYDLDPSGIDVPPQLPGRVD